MITFVAVLIFGGDGLSAKGSCVLKIWCFMIHGGVSTLWLCCTCKRVATWGWQTSEEDISYSCMCLNFELLNRTEGYWYPSHPSGLYAHKQKTRMKHCTLVINYAWIDRLVSFCCQNFTPSAQKLQSLEVFEAVLQMFQQDLRDLRDVNKEGKKKKKNFEKSLYRQWFVFSAVISMRSHKHKKV